MIDSTLRRAALVLAVIASLSIRAAAQTDAAFASALGKIPTGLATMAQLKTQSQTPAAPAGPSAPADVWHKATNRACLAGKIEAADTAGNYTCELGLDHPSGKYGIQTIVWVKLPAGAPIRPGATIYISHALLNFLAVEYVPQARQFRCDSCHFSINGSGELRKVVCNRTMSPTVEFGKGKDETLDLADPKTAEIYQAIIKQLAERYDLKKIL